MLVAERPTTVGNYDMSNIFVVIENVFSYTYYIDYFFTFDEASDFVKDNFWRYLFVEEMSYAQFSIIKDQFRGLEQ